MKKYYVYVIELIKRLPTTRSFDKKTPSILEAMVAFMSVSQQESLKLDLSNTKKVIRQIISPNYMG